VRGDQDVRTPGHRPDDQFLETALAGVGLGHTPVTGSDAVALSACE
jgi:hypothetical protein